MTEKNKTPLTLCVTGGKGGVGKTSFAVNFAIALTQNGRRVLVVDGDMGLANVDIMLRLSVKNNIHDILESAADPQQASRRCRTGNPTSRSRSRSWRQAAVPHRGRGARRAGAGC